MAEPIGMHRKRRFAGLALLAAGALFVAVAAYRYRLDHVVDTPPLISPETAPGSIAAQARALQSHPDDAGGWRSLGRVYFAQGRYADAARAYARSTTLDPGDASGWSALGEAHTLAGNAVDDEAAAAFGRALAIDPRDARARYFLAVAKDVAGDHRAAIADWSAMLRDAPIDAPWAPSVRNLVRQVAALHHIPAPADLEDPFPAASLGAAVASAAIPGPTAQEMSDAAQYSPAQQDAMARDMVERLAARLVGEPHDIDGWIRLMRARSTMGDRDGAKRALADARRASQGDAAALARLSDASGALGLSVS